MVSKKVRVKKLRTMTLPYEQLFYKSHDDRKRYLTINENETINVPFL